MLKIIGYLLALSIGGALNAHAANTDRMKKKQEVESERAGLLHQLEILQRDIQKTEIDKESVTDALAVSEKTISEANRALKDLSNERKNTQSQLDQLVQEEKKLTAQIQAQQKQLIQLVQKQYVAGGEDRIKLLLSGENPNRVSRELHYVGYLSRAQIKLIDTLNINLSRIQKTQLEVNANQEILTEIAQEKQNQKKNLEQEKMKRAALLSALSKKLMGQHKQVETLRQNEQRLSALITKLITLNEQQKKQPQNKKSMSVATLQKSPAATPPQNKELSQLDASKQGAFIRLRGHLTLPVRGEITARFGSKREEGLNWKGLFIHAAEGAEVRALAAGRIIFADWLRGFGNVLIIDHGDQYLSIYGNAQAILKHVGDSVQSGEWVANAGNSGGNTEPGLYFEIRHQGRALDPLEWIATR